MREDNDLESYNRTAMERSWSIRTDCGVRYNTICHGGWIKDKSMII